MKAILWFAIIAITIVVAVGGLLAIVLSSPADHRAIAASAFVAVIVQVLAFVVARALLKADFLAGWVIGVFMRFVALIAYAFVAVKSLGMPAPAALLSLATFLFLSTLVEPKLLSL
ncbi:MAG TPA: hypothetical protein VHV78_07545 [Gemmatimonadaceae bacterium]|nr:hypothetical protein [Gemmatimonadaceae bacterium]